MPNLANINVTITAQDNTGPGVSSARNNLASLGGGLSSIGSIASGVFGGVLGFATFNNIASGIGNVVSSAFGLNNRLAESRAASQSMVDAIAESEPVGTGAFGALSKAAEAYAKTMRDLREKESDGMADYATKIDDIKSKLLDAAQAATEAKVKALRDEQEAFNNAEDSYKDKVDTINAQIADSQESHATKIADIEQTKEEKLSTLLQNKQQREETINQELIGLADDLANATTQRQIDSANNRIALKQLELQHVQEDYDREVALATQKAEKQTKIETDAYTRKQAALAKDLTDEQESYDKKTAHIKQTYDDEVKKADETAAKKVETLNKQLAQEEEQHKRFLRDLQEAYADAANKMDDSMASAGGGGGGRRMINFQFDFGDSFRKMTQSGLSEYLDEVQKKYVELGVKTPFNVGDIQQAGKAMIAYTGGSADNMNKILEMTMSLAARNPMQGMLGATTSMVELFGSGNITSLARRFDIPKNSLSELAKAKDATEFVNLLNEALTRNGITMGLVDAKSQTLGGAFANISETFNLLTAAIAKPTWNKLTEILVDLNKWLFANQDQITAFATAIGSSVSPIILSFVDIIMQLGEQFRIFCSEHGKQVMDWFTNFVLAINTNIVPVLKFLQSVWTSVQKVLEDTILPGMGRIFAKISELWIVIAPLLKKSLEEIAAFWKDHHTQIESVLKATWAVIEFVVKTVLDVITGIIKTQSAIFKGDWNGAWEAIKETTSKIFGNIVQLGKDLWSSLKEHFKSGINGIIDQINGFISSLNSLNGKKVGPVTLDFKVPSIPKLAMGGIVSSPTLAMIGEAGPEAVVPLSGGQAKGLGGGTQIFVEVTGNNIIDDQTAGTLADKVGNAILNKITLQGRYM